MNDYLKNARVFKALGDPRRAMIADMLSCGELCACDILERFEMSQSTLSHHMKLLRACGLVKAREEGKWTYYSLDEDAVWKAMRFLRGITSEKEACICKGKGPIKGGECDGTICFKGVVCDEKNEDI